MWLSSLFLLLLVAALWFGLRKAGIAPRWLLLVTTPFLVVLLVVTLRQPPGGLGGPAGHWLEPGAREELDLTGGFKTLDGRTTSLTDFPGKVLFLNVWATWCGPCRQEMPAMADLYRDFSSQGLSMVAVSNEDQQTVREFQAETRLPFTILLDPDDILSQRFSIEAIPTTFIVDKQGRLIYQHVGANDWNSSEVRTKIRDLLSQ